MSKLKVSASTHTGLWEWLTQRVSGLYIGVFGLYLLSFWLRHPDLGYLEWRAWLDDIIVRIGWGLFILAILWHAAVGLRSVYLDYVHPLWLRLTFTWSTYLFLMALGLWAVEVLWTGPR